MTKKAELVKQLHTELQRQAKQARRKDRHKKGSPIRKDAAIRLHRIKGRVATLRAQITKLTTAQDKAVGWALTQQGVTEKPADSNWGHPVQDWILRTGYNEPEPWCGCFVHEAVVEHGGAKIPVGVHLGLDAAIIADARANRNGLKEVPFNEARKGDIVVFSFHHIALARGKSSLSSVPTIEGNTSPTSSGSQFNGGCVAAKVRPRADVVCVARPSYPKGS